MIISVVKSLAPLKINCNLALIIKLGFYIYSFWIINNKYWVILLEHIFLRKSYKGHYQKKTKPDNDTDDTNNDGFVDAEPKKLVTSHRYL